MRRKVDAEKVRSIAASAVAVFVLLMIFLVLFWDQPEEVTNVRVLGHWTYTDEHGMIQDAVGKRKINWKKNVPIVLSTRLLLSQEEKSEELYIGFGTVCQSVEVSVDGRCVYERSKDTAQTFGKAVASGWNYVKLTGCQENSLITIKLLSPYVYTTGQIPRIFMGEEGGLIRKISAQATVVFLMDFMIFNLGIFWFLHCMYMRYRRKKELTAASMSTFTITFAIWLHFGTGTPSYGYLSDAAICWIALISFLSLPIGLSYLQTKITKGKIRSFSALYFWGMTIYLILNLALQLSGICDMMELLPITHALMLLFILSVGADYGKQLYEKKVSMISYTTVGISAVAFCAAIEIIEIYAFHMESPGKVLRVGIIVYLFCIELQMLQNERKDELRLEKNEKCLQEAQLKLLIGQIQPHFIYNTLGSIQGLIRVDPEAAGELVYVFSKYLRENINSIDGPELIPMAEELRHIRTYIEIEKIRFEERVNFVCNVQDENFYVPTLSLQPLVENAVKHGICKKDEGGTVTLSTRMAEGESVIVIEDDGVGFETAAVLGSERASVGLKNSMERLEILLDATVCVKSHPGMGTRIEIHFPSEKNRIMKNEAGENEKHEDNSGR